MAVVIQLPILNYCCIPVKVAMTLLIIKPTKPFKLPVAMHLILLSTHPFESVQVKKTLKREIVHYKNLKNLK